MSYNIPVYNIHVLVNWNKKLYKITMVLLKYEVVEDLFYIQQWIILTANIAKPFLEEIDKKRSSYLQCLVMF